MGGFLRLGPLALDGSLGECVYICSNFKDTSSYPLHAEWPELYVGTIHRQPTREPRNTQQVGSRWETLDTFPVVDVFTLMTLIMRACSHVGCATISVLGSCHFNKSWQVQRHFVANNAANFRVKHLYWIGVCSLDGYEAGLLNQNKAFVPFKRLSGLKQQVVTVDGYTVSPVPSKYFISREISTTGHRQGHPGRPIQALMAWAPCFVHSENFPCGDKTLLLARDIWELSERVKVGNSWRNLSNRAI